MQAGLFMQPGSATTADQPEPTVGADDVLIGVRAAGICGTDVHILKGEYEATYPLIPGHEFSGVVEAVGANVTRFAVGDRVTADPNIACGRCTFCQKNQPNQCENLKAIGVTRNGAFAQYVTAPEGNVFSIGDTMSFEAAALAEPLACVVWGMKRVEVQLGDTVLMFGSGPMASILMQTIRLAGASRIVVVGRQQHQLDTAMKLGATETLLTSDRLARDLQQMEPGGFDIVVDATGVPSVIEGMFAYAGRRGKVWIFGVAPTGTEVRFPPYEVFRKDLQVIGSFAVNRTFPQALALLEAGLIQTDPLVSHRLGIDEFARGFEVMQRDPARMKIQYVFS